MDASADLDIEEVKKSGSLGLSPVDQTPVYETPTGYLSESALNGDDKKGLRISKIILSKTISEEDIKKLLSDGKTPLIKGFISKKRKPFDAYLLLDDKGKISFEFPPRKPRKQRKKS
jgi:DNA topoisomerase-3